MNYTAVQGDTFESIARRFYGTDTEAARLIAANPGVSTIIAGTPLVIPAVGADLLTATDFDGLDEVAVRIAGRRFRFWSQVSLTRSIDSIDSLNVSAPFDHEAPGFRSTFRPFSYPAATVSVGGIPLFTGTMVGVQPALSAATKTLEVSAYSRPGVLNDCTPPASAFPLEFTETLRTIAEKLCYPFGLSVQFLGSPGAAFKRVSCDVGTQILPFLAGLAQQRGYVISSTETGALSFQQSVTTGAPVAVLTQGVSPLMSVTPEFQPQQYYSDITGVEMVRPGRRGSKYTVRNSRLLGVLRPFTFRVADGADAEVRDATGAKAGRMFASMASYTVQVSTWRTPTGALWAPNTLVSLEAPDAMVYSPYTFLVRSVTFERSVESATATLNLVMPAAYAGEIPEALPWD